MDLEQKREFIRNYMREMTEQALKKAAWMPEEWDGHELRSWLAERFEDQITSTMREKRSKRYRKYRNDVAVIAGL